jgi:uncharacterized protein
MAVTIKKLTNANVYINGNSKLGLAAEIDLPKVTAKMAEHKALGMVADMELPAGFDKMEARILWNSFDDSAMVQMANPFQSVALMCRASSEEYTSAGRTDERPYVVFLRGSFKEVPTGNFKQHENVEMESRLNVTYVRVEYNGTVVMEFDTLSNIYKVGGVDILANYRANIGG